MTAEPASAHVEISNSTDGLTQLVDRFDRFATQAQLCVRDWRDVRVVLDEVVSNVIRHGHSDDQNHQIVIDFRVEGDVLVVTVCDDGRHFDPVAYDAKLSAQPGSTDSVGGAGIRIVKGLMGAVRYSRVVDRNRLVLKRRLVRRGSQVGAR
jgi:anti-sigma regulatory factor (Ser/Thr protein kinase)